MLHALSLITLLTLVCLLSFDYVWHNVIGHVHLQISSYQPLNISSYCCCQYGLNVPFIVVPLYFLYGLMVNLITKFLYILVPCLYRFFYAFPSTIVFCIVLVLWKLPLSTFHLLHAHNMCLMICCFLVLFVCNFHDFYMSISF